MWWRVTAAEQTFSLLSRPFAFLPQPGDNCCERGVADCSCGSVHGTLSSSLRTRSGDRIRPFSSRLSYLQPASWNAQNPAGRLGKGSWVHRRWGRKGNAARVESHRIAGPLSLRRAIRPPFGAGFLGWVARLGCRRHGERRVAVDSSAGVQFLRLARRSLQGGGWFTRRANTDRHRCGGDMPGVRWSRRARGGVAGMQSGRRDHRQGVQRQCGQGHPQGGRAERLPAARRGHAE